MRHSTQPTAFLPHPISDQSPKDNQLQTASDRLTHFERSLPYTDHYRPALSPPEQSPTDANTMLCSTVLYTPMMLNVLPGALSTNKAQTTMPAVMPPRESPTFPECASQASISCCTMTEEGACWQTACDLPTSLAIKAEDLVPTITRCWGKATLLKATPESSADALNIPLLESLESMLGQSLYGTPAPTGPQESAQTAASIIGGEPEPQTSRSSAETTAYGDSTTHPPSSVGSTSSTATDLTDARSSSIISTSYWTSTSRTTMTTISHGSELAIVSENLYLQALPWPLSSNPFRSTSLPTKGCNGTISQATVNIPTSRSPQDASQGAVPERTTCPPAGTTPVSRGLLSIDHTGSTAPYANISSVTITNGAEQNTRTMGKVVASSPSMPEGSRMGGATRTVTTFNSTKSTITVTETLETQLEPATPTTSPIAQQATTPSTTLGGGSSPASTSSHVPDHLATLRASRHCRARQSDSILPPTSSTMSPSPTDGFAAFGRRRDCRHQQQPATGPRHRHSSHDVPVPPVRDVSLRGNRVRRGRDEDGAESTVKHALPSGCMECEGGYR